MGAIISTVGFLTQTYATNSALIAQGRANQESAKNYIKTMNYTFQNLEQERLDAFNATVSDLEKTKLQGRRMESMVNAAVEEGMSGGGRTADLLKRSAASDTARAVISIKDNHRRKMNEIDLNKEAALLNAHTGIKSIQDVKAPSLLGTLVGLAGAYYQGKTADDQIRTIRNKAGVDIPYKTYATDWNAMLGKRDNFTFDFSAKNPYDKYHAIENPQIASRLT